MATAQRQVVVLLGAGASHDAGIPTTVEMTPKVVEKISGPRNALGLEYIFHTLAADAAAKRFTPRRSVHQRPIAGAAESGQRAEVDVERLFAAVELLIDRDTQPWSPFVSSWHSGLDALSPEVGLDPYRVQRHLSDFERELESRYVANAPAGPLRFGVPIGFRSFGSDRVIQSLARGLTNALNEPRRVATSSLLRDIRNEMLKSLFEIVKIRGPASVTYLNPLLNLLRTQRGVTVATLNYDQSIETVCATAKRYCDTGIETWLKGSGIDLRPTGVRLLKLHGSIDWVIDESPDPTGPALPFQRIRKLDADEEITPERSPAVVFGQGGKLRSEGPYLELLLKFASELQGADSLLVVGYSFRDDHVNEIIARWFAAPHDGRAERRIVVLDPGDLDDPAGAIFGRLLHSLQTRTERRQASERAGGPAIVETTEHGRVAHVKKGAKAGLAEAVQLAKSSAPFPPPEA